MAPRTRPLVERRKPGVRSLVLFEADERGLDQVVLACSDPDVVRAVEQALLKRVADPKTGVVGDEKAGAH